MHSYVCHVRYKDGEYYTGADLYKGDLPTAGDIVILVVNGETMKARVGVVSVPQGKPRDPTVHIYVDEI